MLMKNLRYKSIKLVVLFGILCMGSFVADLSFAVDDAADNPGQASIQNPVVIYTQEAASLQSGGPADQLLQRVMAQGAVRVIVGLKMTMRMEHTLSQAEVTDQRMMLRQEQDGLIQRVSGSASPAMVEYFEFIPYLSMFVNAEQLELLISDVQVVSIQEDIPEPALLNESAPLIHATKIWAKGINGTNQVVAVLDTGVAKTHPMLVGKVVSEACYSSKNAAGTIRSLCPGQVTGSIAPGSGVNCSTTISGCDHGTHVASTAAGNSSLLDGVARDSKIIAVQVFTRFNTAALCSPSVPPCISSYATDQIKALERVYALRSKYKIASVNMSLGGGLYAAACDATDPARTTAIANLRNAGIATIIASGNNGNTGQISRPACISKAIAVGNTQKDDLIASSSNHNALVKLMAPGTSIKAAIPGNAYGLKSGTSMATPHVTGAFALLRNAKPTATIDQMLQALICSGKMVDQRRTAALPVELNPAKPRIDLLGAYNFLIKPSNVLRSWGFTTVNEGKDWTPFRGKWAVSSGNYVQTPFFSGWTGSSVANCNTALQVTARMRRVDTSTTTNWNSGVFIKTALNYQTEAVAGYWMAYNKGKEKPDDPLSKPGQGVIWRLDGLNFETGAWSGALLCSKYVPITVNGYNTLRVVSNGSSHSFYLNGKLVCSATNATYASGPVMVGGYAPAAAGQSFSVDYLSTTTIGVNSPVDTASDDEAVMDPTTFMPTKLPAGMTPRGNQVR